MKMILEVAGRWDTRATMKDGRTTTGTVIKTAIEVKGAAGMIGIAGMIGTAGMMETITKMAMWTTDEEINH